MSASKMFVFLILVGFATAIHLKKNPLSINDAGDQGVEDDFDQLLDHSQPNCATTWEQRVIVYNQFFVPQKGAVILFICGEWTCNGLGSSTFALTLAERYQAIVLVLEHRFYGESQPMGFGYDSQSTQSYEKYLNVKQALDDLAYFITETKKQGTYGIVPTQPWITIGGSYPGALSAWFRYKYPHLTVGALAASAVVESVLDFDEFDQQVRESTSKSGEWCPDMIATITKYAERLSKTPSLRQQLMEFFKTEGFTDGEFFYFLADTTAGMIQSGKRRSLCDQLEGKKVVDAFKVVQKLSQDQKKEGYSVNGLRDEKYKKDGSARQWLFQTCSELGYWQTATKSQQTLRSPKVDLRFYKQWCRDVFGVNSEGDDYWANVGVTNTYLGGKDLNVKNLIMTNGSEDPWKHASIFQAQKGDIEVIHIQCDDCAHCSDLKGPKDSDPQALKDARGRITELFDQWIGDHWNEQSLKEYLS